MSDLGLKPPNSDPMIVFPKWRTSKDLNVSLDPGLSTPRTIVFPQPWYSSQRYGRKIYTKSSSKELVFYLMLTVMNGKATWRNLPTAAICFLHEVSQTNTLKAVVSTSVSHFIYHLLKKRKREMWSSSLWEDLLRTFVISFITSTRNERNVKSRAWNIRIHAMHWTK